MMSWKHIATGSSTPSRRSVHKRNSQSERPRRGSTFDLRERSGGAGEQVVIAFDGIYPNVETSIGVGDGEGAAGRQRDDAVTHREAAAKLFEIHCRRWR